MGGEFVVEFLVVVQVGREVLVVVLEGLVANALEDFGV